MSERIDFVFEEAAGRRPSVAEGVANSVLGAGHYLDVDPPVSKRSTYGIAMCNEAAQAVDPPETRAAYFYLCIQKHRKREEEWLRRIQDQQFQKGLLVCGFAHSLSFGFRLKDAGFSEVKIMEFQVSHEELCRRPHQEGS